MSLVELLISMVILTAIMGSFFLIFFAFSKSGTNTIDYAQSQGTVRNVMRALEADLRSADPLVLVPSTFTADPNGNANSGTNGTSPTDVVAFYDANDTYAPCPTQVSTTTLSTVPRPFLQQYFGANVIWAYDPGPGSNANTLIRYSYCPSNTPVWTPGIRLKNVKNLTSTMFTVSQISVSGTQITTPSAGTIANQGASVCGDAIRAVVTVQKSKLATTLTLQVKTPLPNQAEVSAQSCQ